MVLLSHIRRGAQAQYATPTPPGCLSPLCTSPLRFGGMSQIIYPEAQQLRSQTYKLQSEDRL